jgi:ribosome-associated heat shock protein Hsp15
MTPPPEDPAADPAAETAANQRLDRWLWFARFFKSRTLAAKLVTSGKIRVNSERVSKASRLVRAGDVLTFPLGPHIRVIKILAPGTRRGPASEAQLLYEDLSPPAPIAPAPGTGEREKGAGRPTKADRRQIDRLKRPQ